MSNITQNELLQSAKGLLIKYEFSDHALYDNGIDLGIEVPKELRTRWEKEYYEYLVETFDWLDEKCIYRIRKILEYGLADNDFSVLDKFYEILKNYTNIHIEKKYRIISSISVLSDEIMKRVIHNKKSVLCQTSQQEEYIKKLLDLTEEIYSTIDKNKNHLPSDIEKSAFPSKTEEERKEDFIKSLEGQILRLRKNRKIIGL